MAQPIQRFSPAPARLIRRRTLPRMVRIASRWLLYIVQSYLANVCFIIADSYAQYVLAKYVQSKIG